MIDREVGPYWVLEPLSGDPAGTAFKGVHKTREDEVVIRELPLRSFPDAASIERFLRTVDFLWRAAPRRIARIHLCQKEEESVLLVTEYLPLTLEEQLAKDGPLPEETAVRISITVLEALQYLHRYQIVHGRISPSTILLAPDGLVKIGFLGPAAASAATDIFAVGTVIARMLGIAPSSMKEAHDTPATPGSPPLRRVIAKALAEDPKERYASAAEFADALRNVAAGANPKARAALAELDFPREAAALALVGLLVFCLIFALTREVPNGIERERTQVPRPPRVGTELPPATGPAVSPHPPAPETVKTAVEHPAQAAPGQKKAAQKKKHHSHKKKKKKSVQHRTERHRNEMASIPAPAAVPHLDEYDTWSIRK